MANDPVGAVYSLFTRPRATRPPPTGAMRKPDDMLMPSSSNPGLWPGLSNVAAPQSLGRLLRERFDGPKQTLDWPSKSASCGGY